MRKIKAGFMFIEILLVLAIVMFIVFKVVKRYSGKPSINTETQKIIAESGIDATTYKTTIDSTKNKVEDIQNKRFQDLDKLEQEQNN